MKEKLNEILTFCTKNNINVFNGEIDEKNYPVADWNITSNDDWHQFLNLFKITNGKILVVSVVKINEINLNGNLNDISADQIVIFTLSFQVDCCFYRYSIEDNILLNTINDQIDQSSNTNVSNSLSDNEVQYFAEKVIVDVEFLKC